MGVLDAHSFIACWRPVMKLSNKTFITIVIVVCFNFFIIFVILVIGLASAFRFRASILEGCTPLHGVFSGDHFSGGLVGRVTA